MKRLVVSIYTIMITGLWSCENSPQEQGRVFADKQLATDSTITEKSAEQDTTLQPKVELILRATGDTHKEMAFDQDTMEVEADALIELSLINEGTGLTMIHNFVLVMDGKYKQVALAGAKVGAPLNYIPKSEEVITGTPLALPGQTITHEFKAPPPGTYDFVCTYPDHWQTMHGKLIVK